MTPVPLILITELLATAFGIHATQVTPRAPAGGDVPSGFDIIDDDGNGWLLEVSTSPPAPLRHDEEPLGPQARHARRWAQYWRLVPGRPSHAATAPRPLRMTSCNRQAWTCADGRALERVGSWLAQPAGLPTATDILGQCFIETWRRHRDLLSVMHAQAEALHDGLVCHAADSAEAVHERSWAASTRPEAYRHQRVLRHLVETQECLLGPQAARFSPVQRRAALRRLDALLEAERARHEEHRAVCRTG